MRGSNLPCLHLSGEQESEARKLLPCVGVNASPRSADEILALLRAHGDRVTASRRAVVDALVAGDHHVTADEIVARVAAGDGTGAGDPDAHRATVYRTLELLEELGLVNHTHLSHGSPTYHAAGVDQHVHLVCRACGSISEVDPSVMLPVTERLHDEEGFRVDVGHVSLFGECGDCKDQP